jgi:hypothetical protein
MRVFGITVTVHKTSHQAEAANPRQRISPNPARLRPAGFCLTAFVRFAGSSWHGLAQPELAKRRCGDGPLLCMGLFSIFLLGMGLVASRLAGRVFVALVRLRPVGFGAAAFSLRERRLVGPAGLEPATDRYERRDNDLAR